MADAAGNKPNRAKVRSLAAEAKVPVEDALIALQLADFDVRHGNDTLVGSEIRRAREALGMRAWGSEPPPIERLGRDALLVRMLRPMAAMGKFGPEHHTHVVHLYAKGIPDDQKGEARALVDELLRDGSLGEKQNVGQRHVWLTNKGRAVLDAALLRLDKESP